MNSYLHRSFAVTHQLQGCQRRSPGQEGLGEGQGCIRIAGGPVAIQTEHIVPAELYAGMVCPFREALGFTHSVFYPVNPFQQGGGIDGERHPILRLGPCGIVFLRERVKAPGAAAIGNRHKGMLRLHVVHLQRQLSPVVPAGFHHLLGLLENKGKVLSLDRQLSRQPG